MASSGIRCGRTRYAPGMQVKVKVAYCPAYSVPMLYSC